MLEICTALTIHPHSNQQALTTPGVIGAGAMGDDEDPEALQLIVPEGGTLQVSSGAGGG